ncbi:Aste57867_9223 [Aphanomyces stellatus]|uniref:L-2-hydroxyglutarate dehydrogenase, mitochondrial n=1 Tax=Aphanomyces stellatus TaxID=120398 RepID=A0A485KMH1_9STRA|nr:hypothetical protein As57867_009187 [Aphanomyces stellatus]VFT86106.1 Aste57867_9223 [Aphanomyces stellatus]
MDQKVLAVVGGGVVGLAIARRAARRGVQVVVLEKNAGIGQECSGRNSEVIHAGIYYPKTSLKATMCVRGKELMYDFCRDFNVPHQRCGKLIVASSAAQIETLRAIQEKAMANGVGDIKLLSKAQVARMEPDVHCEGGLFSPSTGIVDSHGFMLALQGDAEDHGASVALHTTVDGGRWDATSNQFHLFHRPTADKSDGDILPCDYVINCAGLGAIGLAHAFSYHPSPPTLPPLPTAFAKGNYFRLATSVKPFRHLIYPIPEKGGLGVHATIDLAGHVRFGPDVEWVPSINYDVDPAKASLFASRIASYWPPVQDLELVPDYCGIRPKMVGPDAAVDADFAFLDEAVHRLPGLVHCLGVESPGLTSSLAVADAVVARLLGQE